MYKIGFILILVYSCSTVRNTTNNLNQNDFSIINYTKDSCYARGVFIKDSLLYTANSNGQVYCTNIETLASKKISNPNPKPSELRDLILISNNLYAIQSGSEGQLFLINKDNLDPTEEKLWKNVFLDGIDGNSSSAFMMGDPIDDYFSLYYLKNNNWKTCEQKLKAIDGEAGFAASGSNVQVINDSTYIFVSGGSQSRFFKTTNYGQNWFSTTLPFEKGEGIGAFSICFSDELHGVVVGGNYTLPTNKLNNCFYTSDGGKTWNSSQSNPNGYRSCVYFKNGIYYSCGTNGLDYSDDLGKTWKSISLDTFFAMTSNKTHLFLTSKNGKIYKFKLKR